MIYLRAVVWIIFGKRGGIFRFFESHLVHGRARLVVEGRVRVVRVGGGDAEDAEPGAALAGVLRAVVAKAWRGEGRLNYVFFSLQNLWESNTWAVCIYLHLPGWVPMSTGTRSKVL